MIGIVPHRVGVVVAVVILAIATVLAWLAAEVNTRAEADLLKRQVAQAGTVLMTQITVVRTQLADAGQLATATNANPRAFQAFAAARLSGTPGMSLSLWRVGEGRVERLAVQGPEPVAPDGAEFTSFPSSRSCGRRR